MRLNGGKKVVRIQTVLLKNDIFEFSRLVEALIANIMYEESEHLSFEIKCAINSCDDYYARKINRTLQSKCKNVKFEVLCIDENIGHGQAHNRLFNLGHKPDYIWVVNPDGIPGIDCFSKLFESIRKGKDVGACEARQLPFDHPKVFDEVTLDTDWITGSCFLIRGDVYDLVKGFDPLFFLHCDDVDLSFRIRELGYRLLYIPEARFFHNKQISNNGYVNLSSAEEIYGPVGAMLVAHKYGLKRGLKEMLREIYSRDDDSAWEIREKVNEYSSRIKFGEFKEKKIAKYYSPWSFTKKNF